jgi:branched-chain amino acid transport system permease protein
VELFFNQVINGIQQGAIYAALALALVLIFRSTSLLNFAQGEMAMFSTFIAWILADNGFPVVFAILAAWPSRWSAGRSSNGP